MYLDGGNVRTTTYSTGMKNIMIINQRFIRFSNTGSLHEDLQPRLLAVVLDCLAGEHMRPTSVPS